MGAAERETGGGDGHVLPETVGPRSVAVADDPEECGYGMWAVV